MTDHTDNNKVAKLPHRPKPKPMSMSKKPDYGNVVRYELQNQQQPIDFDSDPKFKDSKWCSEHGANASHDTAGCKKRANEIHMQAELPAKDMPFPDALVRYQTAQERRRNKAKREQARDVLFARKVSFHPLLFLFRANVSQHKTFLLA